MFTVAALTGTAVLLAGSAPANAAPKEPLVIEQVYPAAGAIEVPLAPPSSSAFADFNQTLNFTKGVPSIRLTNVDTGEDVTDASSYDGTASILVVQPNTFTDPGGQPTFECGTTYEVTVGGKGKLALKSVNGARLSGVPTGVTLERGTASWTFTTVPCL
jgi:hypothetical protein